MLKNSLLILFTIYLTVQFSIWFMRSPELMHLVKGAAPPHQLHCPCEGTVREITSTSVRIFLSLFNLHTQYVPQDDVVDRIVHKPNGCVLTRFKSGVEVEQVPGWLARTCHNYLFEGQEVKAGQKLGAILFGSTVIIRFPPRETLPQLHVGQPVEPVKTIIF